MNHLIRNVLRVVLADSDKDQKTVLNLSDLFGIDFNARLHYSLYQKFHLSTLSSLFPSVFKALRYSSFFPAIFSFKVC